MPFGGSYVEDSALVGPDWAKDCMSDLWQWLEPNGEGSSMKGMWWLTATPAHLLYGFRASEDEGVTPADTPHLSEAP